MTHNLPFLFGSDNRLVDFGPPLGFPLLCSAYTVEKLSLWHHTTEEVFESIPLRASGMPRARIEGNLYRVTDEEMKTLDRKRPIGVEWERKRIPVYVPFQNEEGGMTQIHAWAYFGENDAWLERIAFATTFYGEASEYKLADKHNDPNPLLHGRYAFFPPMVEANSEHDVSDAMRRHCRKRNKAEMRRIYFANMRERLKRFVREPE